MPKKSAIDVNSFKETENGRIDFSKIEMVLKPPYLLREQVESFNQFLQTDIPPDEREDIGLQKVFQDSFPVRDIYEKFELDFVEYEIGRPSYTVDECKKWNMSYVAPLRVKFVLKVFDNDADDTRFKEAIEGKTYLGDMPMMTSNGGFVINGAERVIVKQLHRSPGVFFDKKKHPNGTILYSARIIPSQGAWIEFKFDIKDALYVYFGSKQKITFATLLRAFGYDDTEMIELFYDIEELKLDTEEGKERSEFCYLAEDILNKETGELFAETGMPLTTELIDLLLENDIKKVKAVYFDEPREVPVLFYSLASDETETTEDAIRELVATIRSGEVLEDSEIDTALDEYIFDRKRINLEKVGRFKINFRLGLDVPADELGLTITDFVEVLKHLIDLRHGKENLDDIDHLGYRRVKTVGELVQQQFQIAMARMNRTVRERMRLKENEELTPQKLVNAKTVNAALNSFFGSSQLSQFMDQVNPLAEMTNKRRLSALGPGGLTRERAGFEVRDVHYTHYGRMCPIETPEGQNIGLITSLSVYARINEYGFLETPYRKVIDKKVTNEIAYLTADDEDVYTIAQANIPVDDDGYIGADKVFARQRADILMAPAEDIEFMDISPVQLVGVAASLIPFLEHDDANRALMGSNMQRQAVPLMVTERPIVATGLEEKVAIDSGAVVTAKRGGEVKYVDADKILIQPNQDELNPVFETNLIDEYNLKKFTRSNQDTAVNQKPIVKPGQMVKRGQPVADGQACCQGELSLGKELTVAFMPWRGYNFEDAIVLSERLVREDLFTSIHIVRFEVQVRETKLGPEEITRELPNVSDDVVKDLDERGIIRVGAEIEAGDILVGKITPKGEKESTPEERLLRAIFGEKAGDVKNKSKKAPSGMKAVVINTMCLSRKTFTKNERDTEKKKIAELEAANQRLIRKIEQKRNKKIKKILEETPINQMVDRESKVPIAPKGEIMKASKIKVLKIESIDPKLDWTTDKKKNETIRDILKIADKLIAEANEDLQIERNKILRGDQLPPGVLKLVKVDVAMKRKVQVGDKMAGRHGNKGVVSIIVPDEDMPFLPDGRTVDIVLNPLGVPSRMNIGQVLETHLGWALSKLDKKCQTPVFSGATIDEIKAFMKEAGVSLDGKTHLRDGMSGEFFDNSCAVGKMYVLKLSHLADDKLHARSIGPYSLVTQQPLGGKAQMGGQRFGEMEVWALEAYGAAYTLQEMLTVKSDDVAGRARVYEAIVKGENPPEPGIPESFNVLIKELRSLGLDIQLLDEEQVM
ncbi:MAG: DNA-directed RNA polymerase subunit beta [Candidatus Zixiibacteriota bacterium]